VAIVDESLAGEARSGILLARILSSRGFMKRHVLIYGVVGGLLIAVLKWTEYRFLVIEHSIEIYGGLTAAIFAVLGIWLGLKLTGRPERIVVKEVAVPAEKPFLADEKKREDLGITRREMEILELIAGGMLCTAGDTDEKDDTHVRADFGGGVVANDGGDGAVRGQNKL
jgi:hypothetical protein